MSTVLRRLRRFVGFTSEQSDSIAAFEANAAKAVEELDAAKVPRWAYIEVENRTVIAKAWDMLVLVSNGASVVLPAPRPDLYGCQVAVVVEGFLTGSTLRAQNSTINNNPAPYVLSGGPGWVNLACTQKGWWWNA